MNILLAVLAAVGGYFILSLLRAILFPPKAQPLEYKPRQVGSSGALWASCCAQGSRRAVEGGAMSCCAVGASQLFLLGRQAQLVQDSGKQVQRCASTLPPLDSMPRLQPANMMAVTRLRLQLFLASPATPLASYSSPSPLASWAT